MYEFIIGCDMSKATFDAAYFNEKPMYLGKFDNNLEGYKKLIGALKKHTSAPWKEWFFVFEQTGHYSKNFKKFLFEKELACIEENALPIKRNSPMTRGKSDPIDCKKICEYGVEKIHKLKPDSKPNEVLEQVRLLYSRRELFVKYRSGIKVSYNEQKTVMDKNLIDFLDENHRIILEQLDANILELEKLMLTYIKRDKSVYKNYKLVKSVIGVGHLTTCLLLCLTDNFQKIKCGRKMACYAGIAPFPNESGSVKKTPRSDKMGNRVLKRAMSNCVPAAVGHDPYFKGYKKRLLKKKKNEHVIYNNVKNKLLQRVFSVVNRQTPYVKLAHQ